MGMEFFECGWSLGYYANKYNSQLVEYNYYLYAGFPKGRDSEHSANSCRVYLSSEVVTIAHRTTAE